MKNNNFIMLIALAWAMAVAVTARAQDNDRSFEIAKNLEIFASVYKNINQYYVDDIEPGKAMKTAIDAMLASLDPYTNYYPESAIEDVKLQLTGEYGGIGSLIHQNPRDKKIYIAEPYEGFPAQKSGLKAGDIIVGLDGHDLENKTVADVSEKLRGLAGTTVSVTVERDGKKMTKELRREA
ncbi:MAG: PDZ domain-containing protein, partial [Bacteroidales bacterium]|nr:PDZ domain-containing protein [Bacteroidales bacterium]